MHNLVYLWVSGLNVSVTHLNDSVIKATYTINHEVVRLSSTHPLDVERIPVGGDIKPHDHDYYEISCVVKGRALHHTVEGTQQLSPGSVIVIAPGGVHAFSQVEQTEVINLYYLAEWIAAGWREQWQERGLVPLFLAQTLFLREAKPKPAVMQLGLREAGAVEMELGEIRDELGRSEPSLLFLKAALLKVLVCLSRASESGAEEFPEMVWAALQDIELCVDHGRMFDLHVLFRRWPVSPDYGSRLFRQATGLSPQEYYQRRRIQRACSLLLARENTATKVAMELGYADAAHFSRLFSRHMGIGPKNYREKYVVSAASRRGS
jgi:AraC-like DNA-binding protein/mannose-6-phosphate isomerase-like protein (cupin superfamily)